MHEVIRICLVFSGGLWYNKSPQMSEMAGVDMRAAKTVGMFFLMLLLSGCSAASAPSPTEVPNSSVTYVEGADFTGVIQQIDTTAKKIRFYNTIMDDQEEYSYTGGTTILSKNGRSMSMDEVSVGEVYDITNTKDGTRITKMEQNKDVIEVEDAKIRVDKDAGQIVVDDVTYAYTKYLVARSEDKDIDPMEITSSDRVTFRGVKGKAYSIEVTKGHGYIEPVNDKDFYGGVLTVEGEAILPVSQAMLLTVPEGTLKVSLVNGDLSASTTVEVKRGKVTKLNVAKYQNQVPDTGRITFDIQPAGAELYVNGSLVDSSKPVSLKYGNHSVKVTLEGYNDYSGVIQVKDSSATVRINLSEETADVESDSDSEKSSSVSSSSDSSSSNEEKSVDSAHTITVSAPEGAAVYVDGTYKGEAPCSFPKVLGSVTVTLTKKGYVTKSYSVELADDSLDVSWSFPDLEESDSAKG